MKNITIITTIIFALLLAGCNESKNKGSTPVSLTSYAAPNYNGHYLIEPFVLDGDCEDMAPFELIIWGENIYENVAQQDINITGTIVDKDLSGIMDFEKGEQAIFEAAMINRKNMSGDWYLTDGTCIGYLTGTRIAE